MSLFTEMSALEHTFLKGRKSENRKKYKRFRLDCVEVQSQVSKLQCQGPELGSLNLWLSAIQSNPIGYNYATSPFGQ